jgi:prevent-host-death family protein
MITAGVRELRQQLSKYLQRVAGGEQIVVTQHGEPVALIIPPGNVTREQGLYAMVKEGAASWQGGKPHGADHPIVAAHGSMARMVAEDRR